MCLTILVGAALPPYSGFLQNTNKNDGFETRDSRCKAATPSITPILAILFKRKIRAVVTRVIWDTTLTHTRLSPSAWTASKRSRESTRGCTSNELIPLPRHQPFNLRYTSGQEQAHAPKGEEFIHCSDHGWMTSRKQYRPPDRSNSLSFVTTRGASADGTMSRPMWRESRGLNNDSSIIAYQMCELNYCGFGSRRKP